MTIPLKNSIRVSTNCVTRQDWRSYSAGIVVEAFASINFTILGMISSEISVQQQWNYLENCMLKIIDNVAPLVELENSNSTQIKSVLSSEIKKKIILRKRLLRRDRVLTSEINRGCIKVLNKEIAAYFNGIRVSKVRRTANGGGVNLWKAVKIAKNLNSACLPISMTLNNVTIAPGTFAENFARHFSEKINSNSNKSKLDANVYNGKCKLIVACRNFMTRGDVENCLNDLGSKKCEGYDRIPVCTLYHV